LKFINMVLAFGSKIQLFSVDGSGWQQIYKQSNVNWKRTSLTRLKIDPSADDV